MLCLRLFAAFERMKKPLAPWLIYSVLTILLWGVWGIVSKVVSERIDAATNQVFFTVGLLPLMVLVLRSPRLAGGRRRTLGMGLAFLTGLLGGAGNITFFQALGLGGKAAIVVPATALFPVVTVILAVFLLRERMSRTQQFGLVLALAAIYILSL